MKKSSPGQNVEKQVKDQTPPTPQDVATSQKRGKSRNRTLLIVIILLLIVLLCCVASAFLYTIIRSRSGGGSSIFEDLLDVFRGKEETVEEEQEDSTEEEEESEESESGGGTSTASSSCLATGFDDEEYTHGDSYTTLDGCQTCTCNDGDWDCTVEERCIAPEADCVYEGEALYIGDEVVSDDGCDRWVCEGVGHMVGYHDATCCIRRGEYYQDGETISEPCQDCVCNAGAWDCGELDPTCCEYGYNVYENGDTFPHADGCNTCRCNNGSISCTLMLCP